ncbi:MAG: phosphatase PAP2 family protein [Ferruginibacter sp.]
MKYNIRALLSTRKLFFQTMLLLLLIAALSLLFFGKAFAFIPSSAYHPFWLNVFFINFTFMGNGLFILCLAGVLIFRFKKKQQGIAMLYGFLLSGMVVQLLKNISSISHPDIFFEQGQNLFPANDISLTIPGGIISGHTAIAFALATVLSLTIMGSKKQLLLLAVAVLLGYSRIYLAQHYLPEIILGAFVGTVSGIAAVYLAYYFRGYGNYFKKLFSIHKNDAIRGERNVQPV